MGSETLAAAVAHDRINPEKPEPRTVPMRCDPRLWTGIALLAVVLAVAALGGRFAPYDPHALTGRSLELPSAAHPLGTNDIGQDLLSQLLWGGSTSELVGVGAATITTAIAWTLGLLSGFGRRWHVLTGNLADLFLALPVLPAIILVIAHIGPQLGVVTLTLGIVSWPAFARVMRARVAAELTAGYIEAARGIGAQPVRILVRHVLPATVPIAIAKFVLTVQSAIVIEASLAFLGLNDPTRISWGGMIHRAVGYGLIFVSGAWRWWLLPPVVAICLLIYAIALIGWSLETRHDSPHRGAWKHTSP